MEKFEKIISEAVKNLFDIEAAVELSRPEAKFGDLATNIAMQIVKQIGKNPREIAEKIAEELRKNDNFAEVSIAGPGFINLRLSDKYLIEELNELMKSPETYGKSKEYENKTVVTEYSDPNPFKVLHVGHFYTSVIGDSISNLIESAGGNVHRVNFGGDVGLHVAKTIWAIIENFGGENPDKLAEIPINERSEFMGECYVLGTQAYEENENAKSLITEYNKKIYDLHKKNDRESDFAKIYWTCREWSYDYFDAFYDRIGTKFEKYYPESATAEVGLEAVKEQLKKGVYEESNGAVIFDGEKHDLHTRVFINREGLPTYESKDVGLAIMKWDEYHFDKSIIITGNEQAEYMKVVMKSMEQFAPEMVSRTLHLTHGIVKLPGAEKMSSRKGNFLRAVDVLDLVSEEYKKAQGKADNKLTLGAIKYTFLKNRLGGDLIFDIKESVNMQGNSGPYLQYSAVRAKSILRNLNINFEYSDNLQTDFDKFERILLLKLIEFSDIIALATKELSPHQICTYLYELAQTFNRFYENSRVAGSERESLRARLVMIYAEFLRRGLKILGIQIPEKM